jgi:hypothetical protein
VIRLGGPTLRRRPQSGNLPSFYSARKIRGIIVIPLTSCFSALSNRRAAGAERVCFVITLVEAQVFKYKSIEDSTPVKIAKDVTVLVGKNESGKTAFLEALQKALPLADAKFDVVFDYPKKEYVRYRKEHDSQSYAKVVDLKFLIGEELVTKINQELFNGVRVLAADKTFSRESNYGNIHALGINIESETAIASLKKSLEGIEDVDEVFSGAKRLAQVIERIESKTRPADSTLGIFAKNWRTRTAKAGEGWRMIDWHVWSHYLFPAMPRFLYFDDYRLLEGKINLDSLSQRKANPAQLTKADETALGLLELAGTNVAELIRVRI